MTDPIEILRGIVAKLEEGIAAASWPPDSAIFRALDDARSLLASPPAPAAQPAVPVQGEPVATAWMKDGAMVNAFPHPPRSLQEWAAHDFDGHWSKKGYSEAPLYTRPAPTAAVRPADEREAFEAWAYIKDWRNFSREGSQYCIGQLNSLWHGWKARAALSVRPSNDIADDIPGSTAAGGAPVRPHDRPLCADCTTEHACKNRLDVPRPCGVKGGGNA